MAPAGSSFGHLSGEQHFSAGEHAQSGGQGQRAGKKAGQPDEQPDQSSH